MSVQEKEIRLPGLAAEVSAARRFVRDVLGEHPGRTDAVLLTSEIGTNAIEHSRSGRPGGSFLVQVRWTIQWVRVAVVDDGADGAPCLRRVGTSREGGRGVALLDELAVRWGFSRRSTTGTEVRMIEALRFVPGMRVLEIGTGTGYNAACLAESGAEVVSVEIDEEVAEHARAALRAAGRPDVVVITGDGEAGVPARAPFDRVLATAAAHTVPYAWVEQTRPGGLVVVPWGPTVHPDEPLVVLTVGDDGTAEGRFAGPSWFMPLRGQRTPQDVRHRTRERWEAQGRPDASRFGVTVTPDGQTVWLDSPGNPVG